MKQALALAIAFTALMISGCTWSVSVRADTDGNAEVTGTVSGGSETTGLNPNLSPSLAAINILMASAITTSSGQTFDASTFYLHLDPSGSNIVSTSGTITLTVWSVGTAIQSKAFAFTRNGNDLRFASPSQVEQWLAPYDGIATKVTYALSKVTMSTAPDTDASISVTQYQGSQVKSGAMTSWHKAPIGGDRPPTHQQ